MISIVIPAYNEGKKLNNNLNKIFQFMNSFQKTFEVIVVDDGSTDDSFDVLTNYKLQNNINNFFILKNSLNKGKGYSVKKGVLFAKGDFVLFLDADLSTPIEELAGFFKYLDEFDVVIGSRALQKSSILKKQPFYRVLIGKTFNKLVKIFLFINLNDTQCGFKLFKKEVVKPIFSKLSIDRFGFDIEILYLAKKFGFKIKEQPVSWVNDEDTRVRMIDPFKMFLDIFKVRIKDLFGSYKNE